MFGLIPFADVVRRSFFQTVDGSFVGISNYVQVIKNDAFNLAAKNTLRFVVTCIPCLLLLSLILAMLLQQVLILAEKKKKHRDVTMEQFYRGSAAALKSMYLLPMAIPAASVVVLWKILFDSHGFVNSAIHALSGMSGIGQILNVLSVQEVDWMNTDAAFGSFVIRMYWDNCEYPSVEAPALAPVGFSAEKAKVFALLIMQYGFIGLASLVLTYPYYSFCCS